MGEIEGKLLFGGFKRAEIAKLEEATRRKQQEALYATTQENRDQLLELKKQFAALQVEGVFDQINEDLKTVPLAREQDRLMLDTWRVNLALRGEKMTAGTAIRAVSGIVVHAKYKNTTKRRDEPSPFYVLLLSPTQSIVDPENPIVTVDTAAPILFIGTDSEDKKGDDSLSSALGTYDESINRTRTFNKIGLSDEVEEFLIPELLEYQYISSKWLGWFGVSEPTSDGEPGMRYEFPKDYNFNPRISLRMRNNIHIIYPKLVNTFSIFNVEKRIKQIDELFGIEKVEVKRRLKKQILKTKRTELVYGPYRERAQVFLSKGAGVVPGLVEKSFAEFVETDPKFTPYLE